MPLEVLSSDSPEPVRMPLFQQPAEPAAPAVTAPAVDPGVDLVIEPATESVADRVPAYPTLIQPQPAAPAASHASVPFPPAPPVMPVVEDVEEPEPGTYPVVTAPTYAVPVVVPDVDVPPVPNAGTQYEYTARVTAPVAAAPAAVAPVTAPVEAPVVVEPVVTAVVEPTPVTVDDLGPLTADDREGWERINDRLLDDASTEVNVIANDPVSAQTYHVVTNINTRYLPDEYVQEGITSEASMRRILRDFILPNTNIDHVPGTPLPPIVDGTFYTHWEGVNPDTGEWEEADVRASLVIVSPPATYATEVHFRKLPHDDLSLEDLMENGTLPTHMAYFLSTAVQAGANIVFSGIPNTGKTTLLNACTKEIPRTEKVAIIQDVDELPLTHLAVKQKLFTHRSTAKTMATVSDGSASSLVSVVKRTRPNRLFTGECRGEEMYDHLEASAIFTGCMTTIHASNSEQALDNMVNMAMKNKYAPNVEGVRNLVASGVDLIVQLGLYKGRRIVTEVLEVVGTNNDKNFTRQQLWRFDPTTEAWAKGPAGIGERLTRKLHEFSPQAQNFHAMAPTSAPLPPAA